MHSDVGDFREMTSDDVEGCLNVFDSNVPRYFSAPERGDFEAFIRALPGPYYVLQSGADIIACGGYAVTAETGIADLCWGMVRGDRHGRGIGRALTELRVQRALDDPATKRMELNTSQHTVGFYERMGFHTVRVTPDGFAPGLDRYDMVMQR